MGSVANALLPGFGMTGGEHGVLNPARVQPFPLSLLKHESFTIISQQSSTGPPLIHVMVTKYYKNQQTPLTALEIVHGIMWINQSLVNEIIKHYN